MQGDHDPRQESASCSEAKAANAVLIPAQTVGQLVAHGSKATRRRGAKAATPPADLSPEDEALLEALRDWRREAAGGKPAYTVANNRTLEGSPRRAAGRKQSLRDPRRRRPAFLQRHGDDVLELVAGQPA
jgi:HRDC domain